MLKRLAVGFLGHQNRKVSHDGAISDNIDREAVMIIAPFSFLDNIVLSIIRHSNLLWPSDFDFTTSTVLT